MPRVIALICIALLALTMSIAATTEDPVDAQSFYTLVAGDEDPATLVAHMGVTAGDPFREILFWNPQVHDVYGLVAGMRLRIPGTGARPAFPAFSTDFSEWRAIASHTTRFVNSPPERVANIVNAANWINNFFNDFHHPYVLPRDSVSLNWLLEDISIANGYVWGHAIGTEDGALVDIPAIGGGICQLPSTIFPAVMKAGLDVTTRYNHSYYPYFWWGYPEGFGWDATIQPPWTDFVWRNLYDYPVRLFMRADLANWTLTAEVWAPPQVAPYATQIDGPYLVSAGRLVPTASAGWVWWSSTTVIRQNTVLDGRTVARSFWSSYARDPNWSMQRY